MVEQFEWTPDAMVCRFNDLNGACMFTRYVITTDAVRRDLEGKAVDARCHCGRYVPGDVALADAES